MRLIAFFGLALMFVAYVGCERDSTAESPPSSVVEVFPEPKPSAERTEFEKLAAKKKELEDRRKSMYKANSDKASAYLAEHPEARPPSSGDVPAPPPTEAVAAARKELQQIYRSIIQPQTDLNIEILAFLDTEYFPSMLKYAEFCHKAFLAEPNKANGGALIKLVDELYDRGNVDEAYVYSADLVKNDFDSVDLYDLAAASAYCTDHFDEAALHFDKAMQRGKFVRASLVTSKADIETAKKAWEVEQPIRAKEAQADDLPRVKLETEVGDIVVELFENEAPETVANFISLAESGFYDNTDFFSMVLTVHVFTGSKTGNNNSTPGYTIYGEADKPNRRFPFRGALMMAASANEGGSIYSIGFRALPDNFGHRTTFGRVIEGLDVLPKIAKYNMREPLRGMEPTKITKVTVVRKRDHEYTPHKVEAAPK